MYIDIKGNKRQKVGLHMHTAVSDGKLTPEETARAYKSLGYDAIAITDHWVYGDHGSFEGMNIISGAEYNIGGHATEIGVYHILALFMDRKPDITRADDAQRIIDGVHEVGGLAVLAHPAWSLNTPEMIMSLRDIDATEIYNTVSARQESFRPDSSLIVDMLAGRGVEFPLLATDDAHYYGGIDDGISYIMAECETNSPEDIRKAIVEKRFYATQGPEIIMTREGNRFILDCSPVSHIYFASNASWARRATHGEGLTHAEYVASDEDRFVRAFVVDAEGRQAWTNVELL
jgi:histidinol phosphatase-like PHP family hydrolase